MRPVSYTHLDVYKRQPVTELLRGLTPQQLSDAEQILEIFVRNCRAEKSRT